MKVSDIKVEVNAEGWCAVIFLILLAAVYVSLIPVTYGYFADGDYAFALLGMLCIAYVPYSICTGKNFTVEKE